MTRAIAFASALLLLPLVYLDYQGMSDGAITSLFSQITEHPRELVLMSLFGYPTFFISGHLIWFGCRVFNFTMRKLA